ncbi:MAG TPA: discoidin domain-containing protein [Polyangiaceae bacterium]|nr:discoidin domain-containing protein [Polyangiaceae bacterium]
MLWLLVAAIAVLTSCKRTPIPNLLSGRTPSRIEGVNHPERLADGVRATSGDNWDTGLTSTFGDPNGVIEFDLGELKPIRAIYLQGDNNDEYIFTASADGKEYSELWIAPPDSTPGMQGRSTNSVNTSARYIRITARGGDHLYSIGEVQIFADASGLGSSSLLAENQGLPTPESIRGKAMLLTFAFAIWLFFNWRYSTSSWTAITALLPAWVGYTLYQECADIWPVQMREVAIMRAVAAAMAGLAILREIVFKKAYPAQRLTINATLGIAAALSFLSFFNLGAPQFRDHKANQPLFVHNFDMRVYYPVAKYFKELRYDGLYQASVAAYVYDDTNVSIDSLNNVELRDLRNHRITRVEQVKQQIMDIPKRFSKERWEEFKTDMRYFRQTMGVGDYLGSMKDHGGNATPVWTAIAHIIFANTTANNATLTLGGLLDPIMLIIAFVAIWRSFGVRTSLMSIVIFGANDFYMFGSNWAGATLRHDWMVYLALGLCALKTKRWTLGGVFLALSAAIRAFPAFAVVGVGLAFAWQLYDRYSKEGKIPSWPDLLEEYQPQVKALAGAAGCAAVVFIFSSLVFDFHAWSEWLKKVSILDHDPHVNDVSLRAVVAGVNHLQLVSLGHRAPLHFGLIALYLLGVIVTVRNKPLDQAAAIGTIMIPVVFNPANYYAHFIYILPLLALESARDDKASGKAPLSGYDGWIWGTLILVCVAQYWTTLTTDLELHFELASVLLCGSFIVLLVLLLYRDRTVWLPPSQSQRLCSLLRRTKPGEYSPKGSK